MSKIKSTIWCCSDCGLAQEVGQERYRTAAPRCIKCGGIIMAGRYLSEEIKNKQSKEDKKLIQSVVPFRKKKQKKQYPPNRFAKGKIFF